MPAVDIVIFFFFFFFPEISPHLKMKILVGGDRQNIENTRYQEL